MAVARLTHMKKGPVRALFYYQSWKLVMQAALGDAERRNSRRYQSSGFGELVSPSLYHFTQR